MGGMIVLLATFFIYIVSSIEAKKAFADSPQPDTTKQLFFLHNKTLVQISVHHKQGRIEKKILINEEVTDYALDEINERLFWVAKNGSVYVKSLYGKLPDHYLFTPFDRNAKIAFDLITSKLYFTDNTSNVMALDLKYSNPSYHHWHVVLKNEDDFLSGNKTIIKKISLDPESGIMYVHYANSTWSEIYRYNMDGTDGKLIVQEKSPLNFDLDFDTKEFHLYVGEFTIDEQQFYYLYYSADKSYKAIKIRKSPQIEPRPFVFLNAFDVDDVKNLKVYRESVKKHKLTNPCAGKDNGGCGSNAMCLLKLVWPRKSCNGYSKTEAHRRIPRQSPPFDMYSQQPTLRPEPQPTQPDNPYLPVYLSIIG